MGKIRSRGYIYSGVGLLLVTDGQGWVWLDILPCSIIRCVNCIILLSIAYGSILQVLLVIGALGMRPPHGSDKNEKRQKRD